MPDYPQWQREGLIDTLKKLQMRHEVISEIAQQMADLHQKREEEQDGARADASFLEVLAQRMGLNIDQILDSNGELTASAPELLAQLQLNRPAVVLIGQPENTDTMSVTSASDLSVEINPKDSIAITSVTPAEAEPDDAEAEASQEAKRKAYKVIVDVIRAIFATEDPNITAKQMLQQAGYDLSQRVIEVLPHPEEFKSATAHAVERNLGEDAAPSQRRSWFRYWLREVYYHEFGPLRAKQEDASTMLEHEFTNLDLGSETNWTRFESVLAAWKVDAE